MKIPCSIIKEVLPNYVDGCISDEASAIVCEHLEECSECKMLYEGMKKPIEIVNEKEIDYLKKVRKKNHLHITIILLIVIVIGFTAMFLKVYVIGEPAKNVEIADILIRDNKINFTPYFSSGNSIVKDVEIVEGDHNRQKVEYTVVGKSPNSSQQKGFDIELKKVKNYIEIGEYVIDEKGRIYEKNIVNLVDHHIAYVGDNSGVGTLLDFAGFHKFGEYSLLLETKNEPYVINIIYEDSILASLSDSLERQAKAVLASIDNCNTMKITDSSGFELIINYDKKTSELEEMRNILNE